MSRFDKIMMQQAPGGGMPSGSGSRFDKLLQPTAPTGPTGPQLSAQEQQAANEWARYLQLARKHHGDRAIDIAGQGVKVAQDDNALWQQALEAAQRSGWKAPPKAGIDAGIVTGLNDFSFGFSDEVGAGVNAAASYLWNLPGKGFDGAASAAADTYDLKMDQSNFLLDKAREDQGGVVLGTNLGATVLTLGAGAASGGARAGGKLLAPLFTGSKAAQAAPATTKLGKLWNGVKSGGKLAGSGAALGELSGIGHARGDLVERVKEAGVEAPLWGVGGAFAGNFLGKTLGSVIKRADDSIRPVFMSPDNRANFMIERAMKRDGVTIDDLITAQRKVKAMGGDTLETLAELAAYSGRSTGKNLRGLARALHAQPGAASELAEQLIERRRGMIHSGASKAVAAGTGQKVANYSDQISDLEDSMRIEAKDAYDAFRASPVDPGIFQRQLVPILDTPPGREAMQKAQAGLAMNAAAARAALDDKLAAELDDAVNALDRSLKGNRIELLPPRALDEVKQAFDDLIENAGQRSYTGKILRTAKNNLADRISAATGGTYGNALGTFSGGKRLREAIDAGYGAFNKKAWQLDDLLEGTGGPAGVLSKGEVEGVAFGFARALQDALDGNDLAAVRRILRDKGMQQKFVKIMGPSYPRFMSRVLRLVNRQDFDNFVSKGSPTARIQAEMADAGGEDAVTRVLNNLGSQSAAGGAPSIRGAIAAATIQPAMRGISDAWRKIAYRGIGNDKVNRELGDRMFTPMTDTVMRDFASDFRARPASAAAGLPDLLGRTGGTVGAVTSGRDAVPANSVEERADIMVEDYDSAMLEEYLDPTTAPERLRQIEQHFGPQAPELWRLRSALGARQ